MMSCPQTSRLCLIFTLAKASEGITGRNTNFYNNLAENEACEETLELENMSMIYYLLTILSNRALYAIDEASIIQPSKDDQNICEQYDKSKATDSEKEGSENQPNDLNLL